MKKKYRDMGLVSEKTEPLYADLTKKWKQPPVVILQQAKFHNIFVLCLWVRIIKRSDQGVQFINCPSQIFSLIPFYMTVTSYCYYEKVRRTICTAIVSCLLKYLYSFSAAELNNIESEDKAFAQKFSCEESDYRDSDEEDIEQLYI